MGIEFSEKSEAKLEDHETFELSFECPSCQYVHHRKRPEKCPVCNAEGQGFRIYDSSPITKSPEQQSEPSGVIETTFDGRELTWTPEAKMRLNHVPAGNTREQLRNKLEKRAHTRHQQLITEEMVSAIVEEEGIKEFDAKEELNTQIEEKKDKFEWTDEAVRRLARVPEGFMRNAAQTTIEEYAGDQNITRIGLEVAEGGLGRAREKMQQTMQSGNEVHIPDKKSPSRINEETGTFECLLCGYTIEGQQPQACEVCHGSDYKKLSESESKIASAASFKKLKWEDAAKEKLQNVPAGFMREMTKNRIEQWARKFNKTKISLQVVEAKYSSWGDGSKGLLNQTSQDTPLSWTEDAQARIQRVPDFIRPMVQLEVERNARQEGQNLVDGGTLDFIMEQWGNKQHFHRSSS
jgi:rubrerythrin